MISASAMSSCSRSALVSSSVTGSPRRALRHSGPIDLGEPLGGDFVALAGTAPRLIHRMGDRCERNSKARAGARPTPREQRDVFRSGAAGLADDDVTELGHLGRDALVGPLAFRGFHGRVAVGEVERGLLPAADTDEVRAFQRAPVQLVSLHRADVPVSYTHLRAHETDSYLVCRLLLE